uniref:peroxidase n=1 Tax=Kalanchoe fedtschenkoi TaxID=63787 RepID=A0A7N1A806_KALFE
MSWVVPTGRRDGTVSAASEVNLPGPTESVESQLKKFTDKGLTAQDLVTLVGGHTIGTAQCQFFSHRLYNFSTVTSTGADPSLDPSFVTTLRALCPQNGDGSKRVALDTGSQNRFDTSYYANLRSGKGVMESDQMLWSDATTKPFVQRFLGVRGLLGLSFGVEFGKAMVKMGNIGVKTGSQGEIRKVCSAIN